MMDSGDFFVSHGWMGSMMGNGSFGSAASWITLLLVWVLLVLAIVALWQRINKK